MERVTKKLLRERLEWVKEQITAHPEQYSQRDYCGTPCCIAGWLDICVNGMEAHLSEGHDVSGEARLAIDDHDTWLFTATLGAGSGLNNGFYDDMRFEPDPVDRAAVACRAIDAYLKERGA